jgi:hypothetical protein
MSHPAPAHPKQRERERERPLPPDAGCEREKHDSIEAYRRALLHALKEYRELAAMEGETKLNRQENAINYSTAADHLLQQIKVIDERNMDSAVVSLENMGYVDNYGAEAMLTDYVDFSFLCLDEAVEMLNKKVDKSRHEYVKSRSSSEFIDEALETNYSNLKATYIGLLKDVERRSGINDKQWIHFEGECRQWQVNQMAQILDKYQGPQLDKNYKALRKKVNKRLSDFVTNFLNMVQKNLKCSGVDLKLAHVEALRGSVKWRNKSQLEMEHWLSTTVDELNDMYTEHLDKFRNIIFDTRQHIYSLEMHNSKLNQLTRLYRIVPSNAIGGYISKRKHYSAIIQGGDAAGGGAEHRAGGGAGRNLRHPLSVLHHSSDISGATTIHGQERCPPWTLALGSRMYELGRSVGTPSDEMALTLQDMLYDLPDSEALNEKLALICGMYNIKIDNNI